MVADVTAQIFSLGVSLGLLAQLESPPPTEPTRTIALMALLGILLLGMLMIVGVLLGGHWVRRIGSTRRGPAVPPDVLPARRPQQAKQPAKPDDSHSNANPGDTLASGDTVVSREP